MEFIGIIFGVLAFFSLSGAFGCLFAALAWFLFRGRKSQRSRILIAAIIPPAIAIYILGCLILLPGQTLDIEEPLPNGFVLKALGKMPDYGEIERPYDGGNISGLKAWIGKIAVQGDSVFGGYSHSFSGSVAAPSDTPSECCFVLNTKSKELRNFASAQEMDSFVGQHVQLSDVQYFHSLEPSRIRQKRNEKLIILLPPTLLVLLYLGLLFRWRRDPIVASTGL